MFDKPDDLKERAAALERYLEANGYGPQNPKVAKLREPEPSPVATPERSRPHRKPSETERFHAGRRGDVAPYDVANPRRYETPTVFKPVKSLVKNVHRRDAERPDEGGISPEDFRLWREQHLRMTPYQLAAVLRVTARTIANWENGKVRIPFVLYWAMQTLKPADLPEGYNPSKPTRYAKPELVDNGKLALANILKRYAFVMKDQTITSADFKNWRTIYMLMSPEQLAQLVREPVKNIIDWEAGRKPIPFSMWWVMHTTMQDPEVFLTRPGFHDFRIEYRNGVAHLCSERYPDICYTTEDLYATRAALQAVAKLQGALNRKEQQIQELQAENTRLRQMLKAGTVAAELKAMHDHIGDLMKRIHTADVVTFPDSEKAPADVVNIKQAAA